VLDELGGAAVDEIQQGGVVDLLGGFGPSSEFTGFLGEEDFVPPERKT
jgi:hypothetical protein